MNVELGDTPTANAHRREEPHQALDTSWLNRGVLGIGGACLLSDLGHIEGIADAMAGGAQLVGGGMADDPPRRQRRGQGGEGSVGEWRRTQAFLLMR